MGYLRALRFFSFLVYYSTMSQDNLVKLISQGDEKKVGKGHVYYTFKNKKGHPGKLSLKKHNPIARKHTVYKEGK